MSSTVVNCVRPLVEGTDKKIKETEVFGGTVQMSPRPYPLQQSEPFWEHYLEIV